MEIYFGSAILFDDENKIQPNIFSQKFLFLVGDCKGWVVGLVVGIMDGISVGGGYCSCFKQERILYVVV